MSEETMSAKSILGAVATAVKKGLEEETVSLCRQALVTGWEPKAVMRDGLCRGMHQAGELCERHEYFLPELLLASEALYAGIREVTPALRTSGRMPEEESVVLGVAEGDVHEIGTNPVAVMLEADGYRVIDLGYDVPPRRFVEELRNSGARVLVPSTMMTTTLPAMRRTVELASGMEPRPGTRGGWGSTYPRPGRGYGGGWLRRQCGRGTCAYPFPVGQNSLNSFGVKLLTCL